MTWADERTEGADNRNLCEVRELENTKEGADKFSFPGRGDDDYSVRFASAEACVIALSQAAEAVSCGESDVSNAGIYTKMVFVTTLLLKSSQVYA